MVHPQSPPPDIPLWRYGIISSLLHQEANGVTLTERLEHASRQSWIHPSGRMVKFSADTLRHWIYRYRKECVTGLCDRARRDRGTTEIPLRIQNELRRLRVLHPQYTTGRLIKMLVEASLLKGKECSQSAIYRFVNTHGLKRVPVGAQAIKDARAFEYGAFGNMWTGDFLHGPKVRIGREMRKTYLLSIIDDASRFIVYARFFWSEGTESLLDGLSMAIRRFGIPERFYSDNGSAFRSDHLKLVAARLAMHLPHTPAYRPQGRGKIERFFRTVRDQWLPTKEAGSIESLNKSLGEWLDTYHHSIHSSLGESPLKRKLSIPRAVKEIPLITNLDRMFHLQADKKVARNGTVSLLKRTFEIKDALPGSLVTVFYLPWKLDEIYVGPAMVPAKPVDLLHNAERHQYNPIRGKESRP